MPPPAIHILGVGNLGKLVAHSLRKNHPSLPITLLLHSNSTRQAWENEGQQIEIVRNEMAERMGGFEVMVPTVAGNTDKANGKEAGEEKMEGKSKRDRFGHLIVATKTIHTVEALRPWKERLGKGCEVLFLQNGMGESMLLFTRSLQRITTYAVITIIVPLPKPSVSACILHCPFHDYLFRP